MLVNILDHPAGEFAFSGLFWRSLRGFYILVYNWFNKRFLNLIFFDNQRYNNLRGHNTASLRTSITLVPVLHQPPGKRTRDLDILG